MSFSRRNFLKTGSLLGIPVVLPLSSTISKAETLLDRQSDTIPKEYFPSPEVIALNRMALGPRVGDAERVRKMGLKAYIEEQLHPQLEDDKEIQKRLNALMLDIKYEAGLKYKAVDEVRPLTKLNKSLQELWPQMENIYDTSYNEWIRPASEVIVATWVRGVYSKWQLQEVLTEFWHNHFNVSINAHAAVGVTMPSYDRDVIRKNTLGNFRQLLEDVAQSPAMLHYLNNKSSKASPANENYARELFELHTLGSENYYNHLYNKWKQVPGASEEKPIGYIDQDVYEAARAFTGWTVADGSRTWKGDEKFPNTGNFHYYDGWHDDYQKRVLAVEFEPNQAPLADGRKVLDLVARHPGTARRLCRKLCQRLVADEPPTSLIDKAVKTWTENYDAPDQIRQVVRVILNSEEFAHTYGAKVKRPFEMICSFIRATNAEFIPNMGFVWGWAAGGYAMFQWPTPIGNPDTIAYWTSSEVMAAKWQAISKYITWKTNPFVNVSLLQQTPANANTPRKLVNYWANRIFNRKIDPQNMSLYLNYFAPNQDPDKALPESVKDYSYKLDMLVGLMCMSADFQYR